MSINKFGSSTSVTSSGVGGGSCWGVGIRGPRGHGYKLNANGDFVLENRKLCNVHIPTDPNDACNKFYVDDCLNKQTTEIIDTRAFIQASIDKKRNKNRSRVEKSEQDRLPMCEKQISDLNDNVKHLQDVCVTKSYVDREIMDSTMALKNDEDKKMGECEKQINSNSNTICVKTSSDSENL